MNTAVGKEDWTTADWIEYERDHFSVDEWDFVLLPTREYTESDFDSLTDSEFDEKTLPGVDVQSFERYPWE